VVVKLDHVCLGIGDKRKLMTIVTQQIVRFLNNLRCDKVRICSKQRHTPCMTLFRSTLLTLVSLALAAWSGHSSAMGLMVDSARPFCGIPAAALSSDKPPPAAAKRLSNTPAVRGTRDIAWAWLGSPTNRYPHKALGSLTHAGSLHVQTSSGATKARELVYTLPLHQVFEDLTVRLVDLDDDGQDEIIVIQSDALRGSAVVVYGVRGNTLAELARSPYAGSTFLWLNPVGVADFDGDGKLDIASVITPHIGGTLTLYHYRPPALVPFARAMDTSNHRMGDPEQDLAAIVEVAGQRPTVVVPDMGLKALHALRWESGGKWKELADVKPLPARVQRITALPGGACVLLADGSWLRVTLAN
jgi:FG-GAP-like repeat